ncbi:hypothetical protein Chor_001870 [Crotalus horridus]
MASNGPERPQVWAMEPFRVAQSPPAAYYIPDFISEGEEEYLLQQRCLCRHPAGGLPHPKGMVAEKLPPWLQRYVDRVSSLGVFGGKAANHVLVNEYQPGQGIMNSAPQSEEQRHAFCLLLKPRSLLVLQEDMYVRYLHGIRPVMVDTVTQKVANASLCGCDFGDTLPRQTRVSLTIRHVPKVLKTSIILGRRK